MSSASVSISQPPSTLQHTLYLWPHGLFPRRLAYLLLASRLSHSASTLLSGHTSLPNLSLILITLTPKYTWTSSSPSHPKPSGKSLPCLLLSNPADPSAPARHIHESTAIMLHLDTTFCAPATGSAAGFGLRSLMPADPLLRAQTLDLLCMINEATVWAGVFGRHAHPNSLAWSGMSGEELSPGAAVDALRQMGKCLVKIQEWAGQSLGGESGWLTPGMEEGPGMADVALLGWSRYAEAAFGWDVFEGQGLDGLRGWRGRMMGLSWVREYEEDERVRHPDFLKADLKTRA